MQQFIDLATSQLGVSQETGSTATRGLLGMLSEQMDDGAFSQLTSALPGAEAFLGGGQESGGGLGGMLGGALGGQSAGGGLGGMLGGALGGGGAAGGLGGMLGGAMGGAGGLGAMMALASSGLEKEQLGTFVQLFFNYVKSEAGQEMVKKIIASVPQLAAFAGE